MSYGSPDRPVNQGPPDENWPDQSSSDSNDSGSSGSGDYEPQESSKSPSYSPDRSKNGQSDFVFGCGLLMISLAVIGAILYLAYLILK